MIENDPTAALSPDDMILPTQPIRPRRLPAPTPPVISHPFHATAIEMGSKRRQRIARIVFMFMAFALVVPVVLILVYLVVKAWPILSLSFLLQNPANRMTAGGIWAPLI